MEVNQYYSIRQIETNGLVEKNVKDVNASIFTKDSKVYFFEPMSKKRFRLYSIINERSFFL
ncbi:MAG: hypothetical protein CVT99_08225 [Bacteroidetes bacterium HGW-Bacteroidetes-16]|jgi:hypothetical protein|nr:MAG: hypothetical protein CVT99_08225 [Bacteroidetes bacterium HGW-Bacteroidetes-16]